MADKKAKDLQKELHKRLERLLQKEDNRLCFDCHEKGPRWASMNLGIFICLRCAGIHRALGVHISKVRSTTMDNWEPQWVDFMESMGNLRAKQIYEGNWSAHVQRPTGSTEDKKLDSHIREKYEARRWWKDPSLDPDAIQAIARSWADSGPSSPIVSPASPASPISTSFPTTAAPTPARAAAKPVTAPSAKAAPVSPKPAPAPAAEDLLMDFDEKVKPTSTPATVSDDDFFAQIPAKPAAAKPPAAAPVDNGAASFFPDTMGDFKSAPNKEDVKNNILNAFSAPAPNAMGGGMAGPPPLAGHMGGMMGGMPGYQQQGYGMPLGNMPMGNAGMMGGPMGMGMGMGGMMGPQAGMMGNMATSTFSYDTWALNSPVSAPQRYGWHGIWYRCEEMRLTLLLLPLPTFFDTSSF